MPSPESWSKELPEYEVVVGNDDRCVAMNTGLAKEFRKVANKDKAALHRWMGIWCDDVDGSIPDTRMKAQDRFTGTEKQNVLIVAFKSFQARLYGFQRKIGEKEVFFVTEVDPDKKDDAADPKALARAAAEALRVLKVLGIR